MGDGAEVETETVSGCVAAGVWVSGWAAGVFVFVGRHFGNVEC